MNCSFFLLSHHTHPSLSHFLSLSLSVARDQLVHGPVLVAAVRQEPADDERDFFLSELLGGDLEGVGLSRQLDHHGGVHADLKRPRAQDASPLVFRQVARRDPLAVGALAGLLRVRVGHHLDLGRGARSGSTRGVAPVVGVLCTIAAGVEVLFFCFFCFGIKNDVSCF